MDLEKKTIEPISYCTAWIILYNIFTSNELYICFLFRPMHSFLLLCAFRCFRDRVWCAYCSTGQSQCTSTTWLRILYMLLFLLALKRRPLFLSWINCRRPSFQKRWLISFMARPLITAKWSLCSRRISTLWNLHFQRQDIFVLLDLKEKWDTIIGCNIIFSKVIFQVLKRLLSDEGIRRARISSEVWVGICSGSWDYL